MKKIVWVNSPRHKNGYLSLPFVLRCALTCCIAITNLSCKKHMQESSSPTIHTKAITYLALGDSYTIGESVSEQERFPVQLSNRLNNSQTYSVKETRIIARTGWTTANLMAELDKAGLNETFNLVSLLIGVNNQYQGRDTGEYTDQFTTLLNRAVELAGNNKRHVFVVSIPDYGYTPFGSSDQERISGEIDNFNAINKRITDSFGIAYIDITPISRNTDAALTAEDGLHPSAKQYGLWVDKIEPVIKSLLVD